MVNNTSKYIPNIEPCTDVTSPYKDLKLLSINEVREILKIRHETIRKLIDEGKIEVIIIGKRVKIPMRSLDIFIRENTVRISAEEEEQQNSETRDIINNKINSIIKKHTRRI